MTDPYDWPDEQVFDLLNVVEAHHDLQLQYVQKDHVAVAVELGLLKEDKTDPQGYKLTQKGKLLFVGYNAARTVAETEKGLLFLEIESLKARQG